MMNYLLYIDPGSGSLLIQAIIAAVVGALFYFKNAWFYVKNFFVKLFKKSTSNQQSEL
jgi:hypothetical protein